MIKVLLELDPRLNIYILIFHRCYSVQYLAIDSMHIFPVLLP